MRQKKRGRPTGYKASYCDAVVRDMSQGFTLTAWAGSVGISRETVYEWTRAHIEFSDAVARGRAARQRYWEKRLMEIRAGSAVAGITFALRNCCREDWSDRTEIAHAQPSVLEKPVEEMSVEELEAALAKIAALEKK